MRRSPATSSGYEGKRGPVWRAKYRLPDGRQVQKTIGPAWTERGRPRGRLLHEAHGARRGCATCSTRRAPATLPGMVRTGVTFADACAEYLRYVEHDRDRKPSTLRDYRSIVRAHLLPAFGDAAARGRHGRAHRALEGDAARWRNRTKSKILTVLHGVLRARARASTGSAYNPVADVEKPRHRRVDGDRGLLARGGLGARPRRRVRAGRRDLPHRRVHRPAPRRARRAALARRRLRRPSASASAARSPAAA